MGAPDRWIDTVSTYTSSIIPADQSHSKDSTCEVSALIVSNIWTECVLLQLEDRV